MWIVHFAFAIVFLYVGGVIYLMLCRAFLAGDPDRWYGLVLLLVIEYLMLGLSMRVVDWVLLKTLGYGRLPSCPRTGCGSEKYEAGPLASGEIVWKCERCGQPLAWRGGDLHVLDENGRTSAKYVMDTQRWKTHWVLEAVDGDEPGQALDKSREP